ncbi:MAG: CoA transferase, partial [Polymorphobacter sp.]
MFGVIGVLAALEARHRTGRGMHVQSALFETTAYLVGQHMAQMAVTGKAAAPMPARVSAWGIYDVFETADDDQVFVGVVTDALWQKFCALFGLTDLWADESLRANNARVRARDTLMPRVRAELKRFGKADLIARLDGSGLPFAPIGRPEDLFDDLHLKGGQGLAPVTLDDGTQTFLPVLPIALDGQRTGGGALPQPGADTDAILTGIGIAAVEIVALRTTRAVG